MYQSKPGSADGPGARKKHKRFIDVANFNAFPQLGLIQAERGRFLVLEADSGSTQLNKLKLSIVTEFLKRNFPNYIKANPIRDGKILILTSTDKQAKDALANTPLDLRHGGINVKVSDQPQMNTTKATVYAPHVEDEDLGDLLKSGDFQRQDIVNMERMTRYDPKEKVNIKTDVFMELIRPTM